MRHAKQGFDQRGFTLISTMVAVGIAGIVILGLGSVLTQMFRVMRNAEIMTDGSDIVSQIRMNFDNPAMCDSALSGGFTFRAVNGAGNNVSNLSGVHLMVHGKPVNFTAGSEVSPGIVLKSIELATLTQYDDRERISLKGSGASPVNAFRYQGVVKIQMTRRVGGQNIEQPPSFVPVAFTTTGSGSTGSISGCGTGALSQATCESLNYIWDNTAKTCLQANECSYGGSFSNTAGGYGSFVNPFTGAYNCPTDALGQSYDAIRSGSMSWAVKSSKYGVTSNIYPVFSCMICKDANGKKKPFTETTLTAITNLTQAIAYTGELPAGSYKASCANCTMSPTGTLKCACKNTSGTYITSSLNTNACTTGGDISNKNGYLSCPGVCSATNPCYTQMCGGTVTCSPGYTSGGTSYPAYCTESCSYGGGGYYGGFYYQTFDASGNPIGTAIYIPPFYGPFF
jgi:hypothetical protein